MRLRVRNIRERARAAQIRVLLRERDPYKSIFELDNPIAINNRGEVLIHAFDTRFNDNEIVLLEPVKKYQGKG
jgi:hypothetical protein